MMVFGTAMLAKAQNIVLNGTVIDKSTRTPLAGVSITVKGTTTGTASGQNGTFSLTTTAVPVTLVFSYVGYGTTEQQVSNAAANITVELEETTFLGQEVVISASRTPERILESPVSIERISASAVRDLPAATFYDALANLKGVEMSAQSLTFKSVNTRGFNSNGNTRFNQFVDGMDNQAPGLNFSVGNIVGLSELDVDNVELLPGAASALYGAGGINGTLLMTSKNPFDYQGASFAFKTGVNHVNDKNTGTQQFNQLDVRLAKAWNKKFGIKTAFSFLQAKDWSATDTRNFDRTARQLKGGDRITDPNYDGVNVYGDEISQNMINVAQSVQNQTIAGILQATNGTLNIKNLMDAALTPTATPAQQANFLAGLPAALRPAVQNYLPFYVGLGNGLIPNQAVSRTGYAEQELVDYDTKSLKANTSLHYRFNDNIEAIAQANWGTGTSVYTGTDRYSLRNFSIGQFKLELKGSDFFLRAYTTQERSGDAYNATILGTFINEAWKPSTTWFPQYIGNYLGAIAAGQPEAAAQQFARAQADAGRLIPGTPGFESAKIAITERPIGPQNGAKFNDKTNLYHYEGMYNFTNAFNNVIEFQIGASYRNYFLHSDGTIFDDATRDITIEEYGAFAQLGKRMFNDKLKLTFAGRYDKSQNFEGRFTPRITGVLTVAPNNNIRASYQTGYRNPTTQDQYIDLAVGGGATRLIGGLPELLTKYNLIANPAVTSDSYRALLASAASGTPNPGVLETYTFDARGVRPESVQSYELGYKGLLGTNLLIDTYGYYSIYSDFISAVEIYQNPLASAVKFNVPVNLMEDVKTYGGAFGLDYIFGKYNLSGNVSYNKISDIPTSFINTFNTPELRYNFGFGNREIAKNVGFNLQYRWQEKFTWNSTFGSGDVPAFGTFDGQISFKIPSINSTLKFGGSNLLNKYYSTSFGNPMVGAIYYTSITFNP